MYDVRSMVRVKSCEAHCIFEDAVWHALIAQLTTFLLHPGERERGREEERERAAGLTNCEAQTQRTTATAAAAASYGSTVGRTTAAGEHLQLQIEHTSMKGSQFEAKKSQEVDVLSCLTHNAFHS